MNEGVQILLERMKTHPEEFVAEANYGVSKWGQVTASLQEYLSKEDREALDVAWKQTVSEEMQRRFTQAIMEELIDPKSLSNHSGYQSATLSAGQTHAQSTAIQQAYLAQQAQATQAHIQLHQQQQAAQQQVSPYSSLVGDGRGYLSSLFGGKK